jgi:hypothetical protein
MGSLEDWLVSEETGKPFHQCVSCRLPLHEIDAPWLVNKDYHRGECVLEYAICQPCRDQVTAEIDEPSKAAVRGFLENEIDWEARLAEFMTAHDPQERFASCIACRMPRGLMEGYGVSALFDSGGKPVMGPLPLLICRSCVSRMTEHLSDSARETWKRFLLNHFEAPFDPDDFDDLGIF